MVDAVFNHCGRKFAPWLDVQRKRTGIRVCRLVHGHRLGGAEKESGYQRRQILFLCVCGRNAEAEYQ